MRILGLSGSLRKASFISALLRAAAQSMPPGAELDIGTIAGIPLYDGDLEAAEGLPGPVAELKEQIVRADGLLLVSPEYNNSLPGVFKNAIDWTTRPASDIDRVFKGKKVALMGASAGAFGTILSQNAWLPVLRTLGMEAGALVDDKIRTRLRRFLDGFVAQLRCRFLRTPAIPARDATPRNG